MATKFDKVRNEVIEMVSEMLADPNGRGYEVLDTGSNEICVPIVNAEGDEAYLVITFKIPKGSRDGEAYDGYAMAQEFKMKCNEKALKLAEAERKKAEKIKRDAEMRKQKAEAKKAKMEKGE